MLRFLPHTRNNFFGCYSTDFMWPEYEADKGRIVRAGGCRSVVEVYWVQFPATASLFTFLINRQLGGGLGMRWSPYLFVQK